MSREKEHDEDVKPGDCPDFRAPTGHHAQRGRVEPKMGLSPSEDLPPELRSFEAQLAALVPRTDRLDRERLMYRAGRASLAAEIGRRPWAWPAAFSAMTVVAASLLVALAVRPAEHIVEVPGPAPQPSPMIAGNQNHHGPTSPSPEATRPPYAASSRTIARATLWDGLRQELLGYGDMSDLRRRTPYTRLLDETLAYGVDTSMGPTGSGQAGEASGSGGSYRDLRDTLLERPTGGGKPNAHPNGTNQTKPTVPGDHS
jgi:hypothetical protein